MLDLYQKRLNKVKVFIYDLGDKLIEFDAITDIEFNHKNP